MSTSQFEDITNAVRDRFDTLVAIPEAPLVVHYDNDVPSPKAGYPSDRWVRLTVLLGETKQASLGTSKRYRTSGVMIAQVFWQLGVGTKDSNEFCDLVRNSFIGVTASGVTYGSPSRQSVGKSDSWWQTNVVCPFFADDIV